MKSKKLLISLTAKDFLWDYYNGSGKGGQNRNKRQNCVRCFHEPSGAVGKSEDERSQDQNKKLAFSRCINTPQFKIWLKLESQRKAGMMDDIEEAVNSEMLKTKVEIKDENGRWKQSSELKVTEQDLKEIESDT